MLPLARALVACLVLFVTPFTAAAQPYKPWERTRNNITLPIAEPTAVEIHLAQTQLYAMSRDPNSMLGGAVGGYLSGGDRLYTDPKNVFLTRLNAAIPPEDYRAALVDAARRHLDATRFAQITRVNFHSATFADVAKSSPGHPDEQVLALEVRYYLSPMYMVLRVAMTARLGPRHVLAAPSKATAPSFVQDFYYDMPADRGSQWRHAFDGNAEYWTGVGGQAVGAHIKAGMAEVMAMLAAELEQQPRFGRIPGRQFGWQETNQNSTFGVIEEHVGDRTWLRLRNGRLVSVAAVTP